MTVQLALVPILLLGTAAVMVHCMPFSSSQRNDTLERRWETLFSRSMARIPGEKKDMSRESDYLLGIKRLRRLYCNVGIGFHIQVLPDGRINGMHNENRYTFKWGSLTPSEKRMLRLLEISPVEVGVVSLYGIKSAMFVAMNAKGKLYGSKYFNEECKFKETLLPNNYNAYESRKYPGMYIALGKNGRTKKGNRVSPTMTLTHFLPRI